MEYSALKTVQKGSLPLVLVIAVNVAIQIAKSQGIDLDPNVVWSIAGMGYATIISLINWLKNHSKIVQPPKTN